MLDKRYLRQAHEQYDHCQRDYERFRRHRGMTMNEYLTGLYAVRDELIAADSGTSISDMAYARKMLRSAGLTRQEARSVLGQAGQVWSPKPIEDALMMLFADAHLDDVTVKERRLPPPPGRGVGGDRGRNAARPPQRGRPWRRSGGFPRKHEAHQAYHQ